jgi:hypothetical protein
MMQAPPMIPYMLPPQADTFTVPVAPRQLAPSRPLPVWAPQFSPMPPMR